MSRWAEWFWGVEWKTNWLNKIEKKAAEMLSGSRHILTVFVFFNGCCYPWNSSPLTPQNFAVNYLHSKSQIMTQHQGVVFFWQTIRWCERKEAQLAVFEMGAKERRSSCWLLEKIILSKIKVVVWNIFYCTSMWGDDPIWLIFFNGGWNHQEEDSFLSFQLMCFFQFQKTLTQ